MLKVRKVDRKMQKIGLLVLIISLLFSNVWGGNAASLYKSHCAGCHGKHGKKRAVGVSAPIKGRSAALTYKQLKAYKKGKLDQYRMGKLMKARVDSLSDAQLKALAAYIASMR